MLFEDFNFEPDLMSGIRDMRYVSPTPIQEKSIGPALEGRDLIANAQTGSGKTAAFLLPIMNRIIRNPGKTSALVLVPTRELATQIDEQALGLGYHTGITCAAIYGGVKMEMQEQALKSGTSIIIATPGRLLDHYKYGNWKFDNLDAFVLDEADRMLDMGFWPDIQSIIEKLPKKKQMLLFSATMPPPIVKLAQTIMDDPVHIKIGLVRPPSSIRQTMYKVSQRYKEKLLLHLLDEIEIKSGIVFVSTKIGARRLNQSLKAKGIACDVIHGDREQNERDQVLNDFKNGTIQLMVATDVASRGIDVGGLSHVFNFDIPGDDDTYVHRIGRTARADADGDAFTFFTPHENDRVADIEKAIGKTIDKVELEQFIDKEEPRRSGQRHQRGRRPSGSSSDKTRGGSDRPPRRRESRGPGDRSFKRRRPAGGGRGRS